MADSGASSLTREADHWIGRFTAMACPCEVLIDDISAEIAQRVLDCVSGCAWRIERKFSRYRDDNIVHRINTSNGQPTLVDDETARLLDFAATLTALSAGSFDITSGILRRAWTFDGGTQVPKQTDIDSLLLRVGWHRVRWDRRTLQLQLQPGMQLDFGGIGKEYAVDTAAGLVDGVAPGLGCVVNFGGDVAVVNERHDRQAWRIGIEDAERTGSPMQVIPLTHGALATSGDSRRYVLHEGRRYSHILDARTGWPVRQAPRSITVAAATCTQAGTLTTLAMLQGAQAESFLRSSGATYWLQ